MSSLSTYLHLVHKYTDDTHLIGLSILKSNKEMSTKWYQKRYIDALVADVVANPTRNLYIRLTPVAKRPEKGRGTELDALGSSVLWVDYDCYGKTTEGLEQLKTLPNPPTMIVASGNGLQAYWSLDRFYTDRQLIKGANKALLTKLDQDAADSCFDLARVLRAPDSFNMKLPDDPKPVTIVHYCPDAIYPLSAFDQAEVQLVQDTVWDSDPIPEDFIDAIRASDKKLYTRIISEDGAKEADAPLNGDNRVDRSRNDAYICLRLLSLGYSAGILLSVLTHPIWFSGAKYRDTGRFDYVVTTVNNIVSQFLASEDRYFVKGSFKPEKLATQLAGDNPFLFVGGLLYRYENGAYLADGREWVRKQVVEKLGKRWSSHAADETVTWLQDTYRVALNEVNLHPDHVNVANGMLNLHTGTLEAHSPGYRSLNQLPVKYSPEADTAPIDSFIAAILPADAIPAFWEYVGSALIADRYYPKAYLALIGRGDSGKSKLLEWLMNFYGYANVATESFHSLSENRFSAARLWGKLANIFSDVDDTEAQNAGQLKTLTGDDYVAGERKYAEPFSFKNTARLFFSANQHLAVRGPDEAFFNRSLVIRCSNHFVANPNAANPLEKQMIPEIMQQVCTPVYFEGGLRRAYEGLQRLLQTRAFTESITITATRNEFRFVADTVAGFLSAAQYIPGYAVPKVTMYAAYKFTCEAANRRPVSQDRFFRRVAELAEKLGLEEDYREHGTAKQWCYLHRKPTMSFLPKEVLQEAKKKAGGK